jgi:hypothetical protein
MKVEVRSRIKYPKLHHLMTVITLSVSIAALIWGMFCAPDREFIFVFCAGVTYAMGLTAITEGCKK